MSKVVVCSICSDSAGRPERGQDQPPENVLPITYSSYSDPKSARATTLSIEPTIGVEFNTKAVSIDTRKVDLQIWDTAGQERYRAITRSHFRHSQGVLLLYDVTNQSSFDNLERWLMDVRANVDEQAVVMLVANKSDLSEARVISSGTGESFAIQNHCLHSEVSAKTRTNVDQVFTRLLQEVLSKSKTSHETSSLRLTHK